MVSDVMDQYVTYFPGLGAEHKFQYLLNGSGLDGERKPYPNQMPWNHVTL